MKKRKSLSQTLGLKMLSLLAGLMLFGFMLDQLVPSRLLSGETTVAARESALAEPGETSAVGFRTLLLEEGGKSVIRSIEATLRAIPTRQPQWLVNASEPVNDPGPRLAIIIDDVGLSPRAIEQLAAMAPLTLSLLPYAENLPNSAARLVGAGHELMVHLPMEPKDPDSAPGPNAILSNLSDAELDRRIDRNLAQFVGYVGVNNHMGSRLTERAAPMARLMVALRRRGLLYVDSLTSASSISDKAAQAVGVPFLARDLFIDNIREEAAIAAQLDKAETIARQSGVAIAIGHPYPETLRVLNAWRQGAEERGVVFIPISQAMLEYGARRSGGLDFAR